MTPRSLVAALALVAVLGCGRSFAAACDDGGIGGTGVTADGGIGGTGIRAGTELELLGAITGFGSICVNGVEVHYDAATPVSVNGRTAAAADLAIGQVVAVRAVTDAGSVRARTILVADAAIGRILADRTSGILRVGDERVRLESDTVFGAGVDRSRIAEEAKGESVRVSGLRDRDGTIVATRIDRAREDDAPLVGRPALPAAAPGSAFIVQGYVGARRGREVEIGGERYRLGAESDAGLTENRLVRVHGRAEADGTRVIERINLLERPLDSRPSQSATPRDRARGDDARGRGDSAEGRDRDRDRDGRRGPDRVDRPDRPERVERPERPERVERPDRSGPH